MNEFIESFQHMYDEGKRQGGSAAGGAGYLVGGVDEEGNSEIVRRYDPKAMVFVGERFLDKRPQQLAGAPLTWYRDRSTRRKA